MERYPGKVFCQATAVVLIACVLLSSAAPAPSPVSIRSIDFSKQKCLKKESASRPEWKSCNKSNAEKTDIPSYDDLSIDSHISSNTFHEIHVPVKSVDIKC